MSLTVAVAIPLVTAFIGWVTNWAAVKMIFEPAEFIGIGPIGWRGVIHRLAPKLARDIAATTSTVLRPSDLLARFDPSELRSMLDDRLDPALAVVVADAADALRPGLWDDLAPEARAMVLDQVRSQVHAGAEELVDQLRDEVDELVELEPLIVTALTGENTATLARLTQEIGGRELRFIELYGGAFGFLVGLVQLGAINVLGQWWLMPLVGVLTGLATNWLAIQMIFRPLERVQLVGPLGYQGMFPARQAEISADYGRIAADEVFTPSNVLRLVMAGPTGMRIVMLVLETLQRRLEAASPLLEAISGATVDDATRARLQAGLVARASDPALIDPGLRDEVEAHVAEQMSVATTIEDRLASMPKDQFERLLRGVFEEDEIILVVIGGALGGVVGLLQAALVVGLG